MNQSRPLVSIILPTYNGEEYLREAIESCLSQTYPAWELIVVDDCSTDATPGIIAEYAAHDGRIRGIRHRENLKLPGALNTGHAAARGSHLAWLSDDNRFLPGAIEGLAEFLERNPSAGLVYADCVVIDENGRYVRDFPAESPSKLAYFNAVGGCFMYRKSVYQAVGPYDGGMFLAEDYDYWLRVYRQFDIAHLRQVLYQFRVHSRSLTSTTTSAAVRANVEQSLRRHLPFLLRSSPPDRARGWMVCAGAAARRKAPVQAASALGRALWTAPLFSMGYVAKRLYSRIRHPGS
ncbi:MAG TPA: glycosyltransferase [Gemmatimonadales bacterium]|nr:glycosyltransferase [Gemmatimonadales bacterium]